MFPSKKGKPWIFAFIYNFQTKSLNTYLSCEQLKVGTSAQPEPNGTSDQNLVSKSANEVEEKHTGITWGWLIYIFVKNGKPDSQHPQRQANQAANNSSGSESSSHSHSQQNNSAHNNSLGTYCKYATPYFLSVLTDTVLCIGDGGSATMRDDLSCFRIWFETVRGRPGPGPAGGLGPRATLTRPSWGPKRDPGSARWPYQGPPRWPY